MQEVQYPQNLVLQSSPIYVPDEQEEEKFDYANNEDQNNCLEKDFSAGKLMGIFC